MNAIVAIVGRPNVGKSTLFNRLTETGRAIVDEFSGVTRDRHYGKSEWNGRHFSLIDTGGYIHNSDDIFEAEIRKQVHLAIEESDVILFVVDVITGITDVDQSVFRMLQKSGKPFFTVVNKSDNTDMYYQANEFYGLGVEEIYPISAISGSGTGELLDAVVVAFPDYVPDENKDIPRFTVVGRPNVGKSSLINTLLGVERNIVTPIAGTTRDAIDTRFTKFNHDFVLVDTAGVRKKGKVHEDLEFYSVMRSIRAIETSDVCILMIDATRGIEAQDVNIFRIIQRNKKGVVLVVNKWDLMEKETNTAKEYQEKILKKLAPSDDVPVIFSSAITKQRIRKVLDTAVEVYENRNRRIKTSELNDYMLEQIGKYPPPAIKGKYVKIKFVSQLPTPFPAFAFYANLPQYVKEAYKRYLENKIRGNWNFTGVPIQIFIRKK